MQYTCSVLCDMYGMYCNVCVLCGNTMWEYNVGIQCGNTMWEYCMQEYRLHSDTHVQRAPATRIPPHKGAMTT